MKRLLKERALALLGSLMVCAAMLAVPAKRGLWRTITLDDGSKAIAELFGDEHFSYLRDIDGNRYERNDNGGYSRMSDETFAAKAAAARQQLTTSNMRRVARRKAVKSDKSIFQGKKRGLVILVNFSDVSFQSGHDKALYQRMLNEKGFNYSETSVKVDESSTNSNRTYTFDGSVQDYFRDQSLGQFELDFDVVGPVTVSKPRAYYGGAVYTKRGRSYSQYSSDDANPGVMVVEALKLADKAGVDFSQYDWDGDGAVDQVFVLYAGQGEADGGAEYCIWPHEWTLSAAASYQAGSSYYYYDGTSYHQFGTAPVSVGQQTIDGVTINTYACGNELGTLATYNSSTQGYDAWATVIDGIGTFCHEFSHCLGYPDMYDTSYTYYGMGYWDLMDSGSYNGNSMGYKPAGYTSWERWVAGWIEPTVLTDPEKITNLPSLQSSGKSYIVYARSSDYTGEYYLLENRQWDGWDYALPYHGLLIIHADYNATSFNNNSVNTSSHQRMTVFHAGNDETGYAAFNDVYPWDVDSINAYLAKYYNSNWNTIDKWNGQSNYSFTLSTTSNNALTTSTTPAATYWNGGSTARSFSNHEIREIEDNADGTVNFIYRYPSSTETLALDETTTTAPSFTKKYYNKVTLNRSLTAGTWSTMWLPFSLSQKEAKAAFGDDVAIAHLSGFTTNDEGSNVLRFDDATSAAINAYEPFLIKVGSDLSSLEFSEVEVQASETPTVTSGSTSLVGATTYGTIPEGDYFLSDNQYYQSTGTSKLRAFRAYITADETSGAKASGLWQVMAPETKTPVTFYREPSEIELYDIIKSAMATGITTVGHAVQSADSGIYNLSGQRVGTDRSRLKKGIYVVGGKKIIVK